MVCLAALALSAGPACRGRNLASTLAQTPAIDTQGQARCGVMKSHARPLIIEWPSSDRGALEGMIIRRADAGLVAVRYESCEMELLRRCTVAGRYTYTGVGAKRDDQMFRSADELYARIPLGAAQLEGELERHGALSLAMTVVGHYEAGRARVDRRELRGDCERATHVISAVTVGAFRLASAAGAEVSAGGGISGGPMVGAGSSAERGFERSDGDPDRCSNGDDSAPPEACSALLRLEVEPIREPGEVSARRQARPCPRGTALVEGGTFRPSVPRGQAEVEVDDFCIDLHEVTVADYADCVADGPCSAAPTTVQAEAFGPAQRAAESLMCNGDRGTRGRHPVNCVAWHQADTYCRAQGGRLPGEHEWEWAARGGVQERSYPWGESEPGPDLVNACDRECAEHFAEALKIPWTSLFAAKDGDAGTARVGRHRRGAGRGRVQDLAGNVWEWTASHEVTYRDESEQHAGGGSGMGGPDTGNRVIRGGGFKSSRDDEVRVTARGLRPAKDRRPDLGFRCVRDP
jgi:formylglycine-generating enzyme required for sulfatase activity